MTEEREHRIIPNPDDVAAEDDRAAAAEAAAIEQDDNLVNEAAVAGEVTIPATPPIDQPNAIPPDGVR